MMQSTSPLDPTDATTRQRTTASEAPVDDDIEVESPGCWAYCIDLSYVAAEPSRILELRTVEAHKRLLWGPNEIGEDPPRGDNCRRRMHHSIVHPKLEYQPRLPRTGSVVMSNWCTAGSVTTAGTAESSLSKTTQASASLADLDEDDADDVLDGDEEGAEVEVEDLIFRRMCTERNSESGTLNHSPCRWGYFVDSSSPTPSPDQRIGDPLEASTQPNRPNAPPYRRFMSKEIAACSRYNRFAPVLSPGERRLRSLYRVPARGDLRVPTPKMN